MTSAPDDDGVPPAHLLATAAVFLVSFADPEFPRYSVPELAQRAAALARSRDLARYYPRTDADAALDPAGPILLTVADAFMAAVRRTQPH